MYSKVPARQFNLNVPTMFWIGKKMYALTSFVIKNMHNNKASRIQTVFYWKIRAGTETRGGQGRQNPLEIFSHPWKDLLDMV